MHDCPLFSIIILNYNGLKFLGEDLKRCLESVLKTNYPSFEVLFIDNGSTDRSVNLVETNFNDPRLTIIKNEINLGFAEGNNVGIKASRGKYIVLLNTDIIVKMSWIEEIIKVMESDPKVGIAGCKVMLYGRNDMIDCIGSILLVDGRPVLIGHGEKDRGQYDTIRDDFDYVSGAAIVIRREVFQKIGLLDPGYFLFYEETDFCHRARKAGYKVIYVPKAIVWHKHSATFLGIDPAGLYKFYMLNRQRIRYILINFNPSKILRALLSDCVPLLFINSTQRLLIIRAYWWNVKNLLPTLQRRFHNKFIIKR